MLFLALPHPSFNTFIYETNGKEDDIPWVGTRWEEAENLRIFSCICFWRTDKPRALDTGPLSPGTEDGDQSWTGVAVPLMFPILHHFSPFLFDLQTEIINKKLMDLIIIHKTHFESFDIVVLVSLKFLLGFDTVHSLLLQIMNNNSVLISQQLSSLNKEMMIIKKLSYTSFSVRAIRAFKST